MQPLPDVNEPQPIDSHSQPFTAFTYSPSRPFSGPWRRFRDSVYTWVASKASISWPGLVVVGASTSMRALLPRTPCNEVDAVNASSMRYVL